MELEISVEDLLNKRKIESDRIEFKAGWNPDDIYHSVCAFANDYNNDGGGYIVVGIEEKNGMAVRPVKGLPEYMLDEIQKDMISYNNISTIFSKSNSSRGRWKVDSCYCSKNWAAETIQNTGICYKQKGQEV